MVDAKGPIDDDDRVARRNGQRVFARIVFESSPGSVRGTRNTILLHRTCALLCANDEVRERYVTGRCTAIVLTSDDHT